MKRDSEYMYELMKELENLDEIWYNVSQNNPKMLYHTYMLKDLGYVIYGNVSSSWIEIRLTAAGHDYINIQDHRKGV